MRDEMTTDEGARDPDFIPPRKPYSFLAMLDSILQFSAETLVDHGRLSFWMPTANDENQEIPVPTHPYLEIVSICTQSFNKCVWSLIVIIIACCLYMLIGGLGSRRLITYRRIPDVEVDPGAMKAREERISIGKTADELNPFRKAYFSKFEA
jgi:tRNA (guanine10-N2)-methyltransferase